MKRGKPNLWIVFVVALALPAVPARAQDDLTNAVGVMASYGAPRDLDRGAGLGLSLTHVVATLLSFEFGIEHYAFDDRESGVMAGTVNETPLLVTMQIRPQFGWNPYLGVGVGYYFISYDQDASFRTLCNCELTVDNAVVAHVAVGFDVPLNERLTLTLDVRSAWGDANATSEDLTSGAASSDEVKLDYRKVGIGLKYWF